MTKDELTTWALAHGWTMQDGMPSLLKPARPGSTAKPEAVIRLVMKATVVHLEAKKPAGKWEKFTGAAYGDVTPTDDGMPVGLKLETIPAIRQLMQENRDRQVFG